MGLDTTHDCWHGPYSAFHWFRIAVAQAAGYGIDTSDANDPKLELWKQDWPGTAMGKWDDEPGDVLLVFLLHSDCDGLIPAKFVGALARRLDGLKRYLDEDWHERLDEFVAGLRAADEMHQDVEFH